MRDDAKLRGKLTYANVVSTLCLFLVVSGGAAIAANQLPRNSVGTAQLKKNAVKTGKIARRAVKAGKLPGRAVRPGHIAPQAVRTGKIASAAVAADKLADGAVQSAKLANGAVSSDKLANGAVTDSKLATQFLPANTLGVPVAGARVASNGGLQRSFNRFGGPPAVFHEGVGVYRLVFPGLEGQAYISNSVGLVSLLSEGEVARSSSLGDPLVVTFDSAGTAANRPFDFVLFVPGGI